MSLKNSVTPPGVDPGTVQLVAQRLNHYTNPGPVKVFSEVLMWGNTSYFILIHSITDHELKKTTEVGFKTAV
jgi:hypothetical protein